MNAETQDVSLADLKWAIVLLGPDRDSADEALSLPEVRGASLYVSDMTSIRTRGALVDRLAGDFKIPGRMGDLNAALSSLADLDWAPNRDGYLWVVRGLANLRANNGSLFDELVLVMVHVCDRWRSREIAFRILCFVDDATRRRLSAMVAAEAAKFSAIQGRRVDFVAPTVVRRVDGRWLTS